jgi:HAD superfamily hydrolase (TIGR01509 family)
MPVRAVIFDCDGTLVDSEPIGFSAMQEEARKLGIVFADGEDLLGWKGESMSFCLAQLALRWGRPLPEDFLPRLRERMALAFKEHLQPIPGALAMLQGLKVPFCVASNGPRHKIELNLGLTQLLPLFQGRIFSAFEVGAWKPDPGLFLHAAQALGVPADQCAVVEDSVAGIQAGLAAGMQVYALHSPQALPEALRAQVQPLHQLTDLCLTDWNQ